MIGKTDKSPQLHMYQVPIIQFINKEHELYQLSERINWVEIEQDLTEYYCVDNGRPSIPIRKIVGVVLLKRMFNESDESVVDRWKENPYWQHFCGEVNFQHNWPFDPTELIKFRHRLGEIGMGRILKISINLFEKKEVQEKIYPIFGLSLLIMAVGIGVTMVIGGLEIPELVPSNIINMHDNPSKFPTFPLLFITIACGAISGFHSTQSPLMARCLPNEKDGKKIFFGAMIAEGIVALIWAAVGMSFFGGVRELGETLAIPGQNVAWVVNEICNGLLGKIGGILAIVGVVAAPITSGDTAFRSARLTIADSFNIKQDKLIQRFYITLPLFAIGLLLTQIDFSIIWRYFGWANQTLSVFVLWTAAVYMQRTSGRFWFVLIPAVFMTAVVVSYILIAPEGFHLSKNISYWGGVGSSMVLLILFLYKPGKSMKNIT